MRRSDCLRRRRLRLQEGMQGSRRRQSLHARTSCHNRLQRLQWLVHRHDKRLPLMGMRNAALRWQEQGQRRLT